MKRKYYIGAGILVLLILLIVADVFLYIPKQSDIISNSINTIIDDSFNNDGQLTGKYEGILISNEMFKNIDVKSRFYMPDNVETNKMFVHSHPKASVYLNTAFVKYTYSYKNTDKITNETISSSLDCEVIITLKWQWFKWRVTDVYEDP